MRIPPASAYVQALRSGKLSKSELKALKNLYAMPNHSGTAGQVARALGYKGFGGANRAIGSAGHKLANVLKIKSPFRNNKGENWFSIIADCENRNNHWVWKMRPQMVNALQQVNFTGEDSVHDGARYWVIKAKPDRNDFSTFPAKGRTGRWYTKRLPKDWKAGDFLYIWAASPQSRVIGLGRLAKPNDGYDEGCWHFCVQYLSNYLEGPTMKELRKQAVFRGATFLKSGPAGTVYPLTEQQGTFLRAITEELAPTKREAHVTKDDELKVQRNVGAGFGSPEENRKVEQAAVRAIRLKLKNDGWVVRSVERERRGYDLECRNGRKLIRVEVKGIRGTEPRFILTAGEYDRARKDPSFVLGLVMSALKRPVMRLVYQRELVDKLHVAPLAYKAELV
jgi:hypothetical protein